MTFNISGVTFNINKVNGELPIAAEPALSEMFFPLHPSKLVNVLST